MKHITTHALMRATLFDDVITVDTMVTYCSIRATETTPYDTFIITDENTSRLTLNVRRDTTSYHTAVREINTFVHSSLTGSHIATVSGKDVTIVRLM